MSNGGIIGPKNNTSETTASGVWSLGEQYSAVKNGEWPFAKVFYTANSQDVGAGPTFNFTSVNIDGPGLIVVAFGSENAASAVSAVIDGVTANLAVGNEIGGEHSSIWYAKIDSLSSSNINISVTTGTSGLRSSIGVYRIKNYSSATPYYTNSATSATSPISLSTGQLNPKTALIASFIDGAPGSVTWSPDIEDYETTTSEAQSTFSSGHANYSNSENLNFTVTSTGNSNLSLCVAAWN